MAGNPWISAMDPLRMIVPPAFIKGRPFWTEKKRPFTFASK
jgi:hypothetical protein